jgi:basic membrane protein A
MEDLTGRQFGHYQIVAPLGEGGMAAVYRAYQPSMERFVAVKVLPRHMASSEEFVNRFRREARLLAQLQHPHILPVFDYGEADGYPYIVMPFVQSGTLAELLQKRQQSLSEVRRIMIQLGDALSYAHTRGMIHRDIKPSNVLIDERGNCLLTDFGLARMAESATKITTSGTVMGTPAYMSPEQGAGSTIDHRSDIYSLGIIFYEMVTGRVPYVAETPIAVVFKHIQDPLPSARKLKPNLPEAVELVLLKALAKQPEDRYQTAEEFVKAIQRAIPEGISPEAAIPPTTAPDVATVMAAPVSVGAEERTEVQPASGARTVQSQAPAEFRRAATESRPPRRFPVWAVAGTGLVALVGTVIVILMSAVNSKDSPTPTMTSPVLNTAAPLNSPVPSPTSPPPVEASSGEVFRDEFDGQLAAGWMWLAEDPSRWSLSAVAGALQITAADASLDGPALPPNILVRDVPAADFEITTSVRFEPNSNYQAAGLIVFQDQGNALQFGRAFCDLPEACVGDGLYLDNFENGSVVGSNFRTEYHGPVAYLRLQRVGNTYSGYFSENGEQWIKIGEHIRAFSQIRVGLIAAQAPVAIPAVFDYFTLNVVNLAAAGEPGAALPVDFQVAQVTDLGGIDDKSFNTTAYNGIERAMQELGVQGKFLESQQQSDYARNIQQLLEEDTDLIVTVGFLLGVDTANAAKANPSTKFAIVDYSYPDCFPGGEEGKTCGSSTELPNVLGLTFSTDQAAFLAGYAAAASTQTGKVATFGGINIPPVVIFMKGFEAGVNHYNKVNGANVEVLGWNTAANDGSFTGNFESLDDGFAFAESFAQEGADIILPVAGPVGLGSAAYCQESGSCRIIGVDTDWMVSAPQYREAIFTSILKNMDVAVFDVVRTALEGNFKGGMYVGTLQNDGVGLAAVNGASQDLLAALADIRADLINGRIRINP